MPRKKKEEAVVQERKFAAPQINSFDVIIAPIVTDKSMQLQKEQNKPKCPTCGSTNVKHISTLNRAVSIGVFGLFSSKIGKSYECQNCKAKW